MRCFQSAVKRSQAVLFTKTVNPTTPLILSVSLAEYLTTMALSQDGKILATTGAGRSIRLWQADGSKLSPIGSFGLAWDVYGLVISPDGRFLGCTLENGSTVVYDLEKIPAIAEGRTLPALLETGVVFDDGKAFSPDNKLQGGESALLNIKIVNKGTGSAYRVVIRMKSNSPYISLSDSLSLGDLPPGITREVSAAIAANLDLGDGNINVEIQAKERSSFAFRARSMRRRLIMRSRPRTKSARVG